MDILLLRRFSYPIVTCQFEVSKLITKLTQCYLQEVTLIKRFEKVSKDNDINILKTQKKLKLKKKCEYLKTSSKRNQKGILCLKLNTNFLIA